MSIIGIGNNIEWKSFKLEMRIGKFDSCNLRVLHWWLRIYYKKLRGAIENNCSGFDKFLLNIILRRSYELCTGKTVSIKSECSVYKAVMVITREKNHVCLLSTYMCYSS